MLQKFLPTYDNLPIIPEDELKSNNSILYYDELVVNTANFSHPGTNQLFYFNIKKDIFEIFLKNNHSFNA